jgi:methionyl-tRNA formyltransferase
VVGVVTQPDRPAGRGHKLVATPVKRAAEALGLRTFTPQRLKAFVEEARALAPDAFVVASYGRIVPQALLDLPQRGAFNVHPSLLPRYRGATPLQSAIRDGRTETGVSIILMDAGMDTGDVVLQEPCPLLPGETYGELHDRLAIRGAALLVEALELAERGALERRPQASFGVDPDEIARTLTRPLGAADLVLDQTRGPAAMLAQIRSLAPSPAARITVDGEPLKLLAARAARDGELPGSLTADGGVVHDGIVLLRVVAPNRPAMSAAAWRRSQVRS